MKILRKTGRCANGGERDGGRIYHAVENHKALCRAEPGRLSGWSSSEGENITCARCLRKLSKAITEPDYKSRIHERLAGASWL